MLSLDPKELKLVLLKSLDFPLYARPDYFLKEQETSGWSKLTYLHGLYEAYWHLLDVFRIYQHTENTKTGKETKPQKDKSVDPFVLDLARITDGLMQGKLNQEKLTDLEYALDLTRRKDLPERVFSGWEILNLNDRALRFIEHQFNKQLRNIHPGGMVYLPDQFSDKSTISPAIHTVYHFYIRAEGPFMNYFAYRNELRNLLLNSRHPEKLKHILKAALQLARSIVDLYNDHLYPAEFGDKERAQKREAVTVELDLDDLSISYLTDIPQNKHRLNHGKHYWNQDLAKYAADIANLIAAEVMDSEKKTSLRQTLFKVNDREIIEDINRLLEQHKELIADQCEPIHISITEISNGSFTISTLRNLIPSVESIIRKLLVIRQVLQEGEEKTLGPMIELLKKALKAQPILTKKTIQLIELVKRNPLIHANMTPEGTALEHSLLEVLSCLRAMLADIS